MAAAFLTAALPLFVLQHAGETVELMPALAALHEEGRPFNILAIGTAASLVAKVHDLTLHLVVDPIWSEISPQKPIQEGVGATQVDSLLAALQPSCVITGVATQVQAEFLLSAKERSIPTYALWDNPEPDGATPYFIQARKTAALARTLFAPSTTVAASFPTQKTVVVGKPSLASKLDSIQQVDRSTTLGRIGFSPEIPVITILGTKGSGFDKAIPFICQALEGTPCQVVIQIHPQSDTKIEQESAETHLSKTPHILSTKADGPLTYEEAIAIAKTVITYDSSGGFDAFLAGKRVLYASPATLTEGERFTNSLITQGLASHFDTPQKLHELLAKQVPPQDADATMRAMGLPSPEESTKRILSALNL